MRRVFNTVEEVEAHNAKVRSGRGRKTNQRREYEQVVNAAYGILPEAGKKPKTAKRKPKTDYKAIFLNHLHIAKLPPPTHGEGCENPELVFHETRKWRFDFAWTRDGQKIACEYQGLNWAALNNPANSQSGHQSIKGLINDCEKFTEASLAGWTLILITAESVNSGHAITWVERALRGKQ